MDDVDRVLGLVWQVGLGRPVATEHLAAVGRSALDDPDWSPQAALQELFSTGGILDTEEGWRVPNGLVDRARGAAKAVLGDSFGRSMIRHAESPAYQEYCRRAYGADRFQFDMADGRTLDRLLAALALETGDRFVDLGCGLGTVTAWIAGQTGARGLGIDLAPGAVVWARTHHGRDGLEFQEGDLDALELPSLEAAVAIDTLFFAHDLDACVEAVFGALVPGGRFVATFTAKAHRDDGLELERMRLGKALVARGVEPQGQDLTDAGQAFWERAEGALVGLEPQFREEGSGDLWDQRMSETRSTLDAYRAGNARRWLVVARA